MDDNGIKTYFETEQLLILFETVSMVKWDDDRTQITVYFKKHGYPQPVCQPEADRFMSSFLLWLEMR